MDIRVVKNDSKQRGERKTVIQMQKIHLPGPPEFSAPYTQGREDSTGLSVPPHTWRKDQKVLQRREIRSWGSSSSLPRVSQMTLLNHSKMWKA